MLIKIIAGVFGLNDHGRIKSITQADGPVEVEAATGARLIKRGQAVEIAAAPPEKIEKPQGTTPAAPVEPIVPCPTFPAYTSKTAKDTLQDIAEAVGIDPAEITAAKTKKELLALLDDAKAEFLAEDGEDGPAINISEAME